MPIKEQNKGGRPQVHDWDAFDREVVRVANLDGFDPDPRRCRTEMTHRMTQWCAANWPKEPAQSQIRVRLARLLPQ
jgi:hypothetical protein